MVTNRWLPLGGPSPAASLRLVWSFSPHMSTCALEVDATLYMSDYTKELAQIAAV